MLRKLMFIGMLLLLLPVESLQARREKTTKVRFETSEGGFTVELFNDTPQHRDNFIKLVRQGYYDGMLFHRIIANFMSQSGDPNTKTNRDHPETFGEGGPGYTLPAEIFPIHTQDKSPRPLHYHLRGALAMAREGDEVNPERRSSGSQFYIVWGHPWDAVKLQRIEQSIGKNLGRPFTFPDSIRQSYMEEGGAPHLDGRYTVFGRVLSGEHVVEYINHRPVDANTHLPLEDVMIIRAKVLGRNAKK